MVFADSSGNTATVSNPIYGYTVEHRMSAKIVEGMRNFYWQDNGINGAYDYRVLTKIRYWLTASEMSALSQLFISNTKGRGETLELRLGSSRTGFYPFGPDKGDVGTFEVRIVSRNQGGMMLSPYQIFDDTLDVVAVSCPSYSPQNGSTQGAFAIGSVSGLMYPQSGFSPEYNPAHKTTLTNSGSASAVDLGGSADTYQVSMTQEANTGKASSLVQFLIGATGRGSDISITPPAGSYMYGIDNGSGGSAIAKNRLLQTVIKMTHSSFDEWQMPLKFAKVNS
jgi:hypothetical protein